MLLNIYYKMTKLIDLLNESFYDSNKLYSKQYIINVTTNAPRNIKDVVRNLKTIDCIDSNNNKKECVRIPEVLYIYISGKY